MKIRQNGSRPLDNSVVCKQYSAEKILANDFSVIGRDSQFIYRPSVPEIIVR